MELIHRLTTAATRKLDFSHVAAFVRARIVECRLRRGISMINVWWECDDVRGRRALGR